MTDAADAATIIRLLGLEPHPEGGHFVETWRDNESDGQRGSGTAIYFLLKAGERSAWHRIDATEIWHFYAGAPLRLTLADETRLLGTVSLGPDVPSWQRPQEIVPPYIWQSAETTGPWTLVGCTVSPAFEFAGFEMAPKGWEPTDSGS
jgi:predicted cupin superfamily sugar epimerase